MKLAIRIVLALLAIVVLAAVAVPFLLDVNTFKTNLESSLYEALGRPVSLGKLHLELWQGRLSADSFSIAEDPSFGKKPFASASAIHIGVELWPLIREMKLNVTDLTVDKPEIRLIQQADGDWNFSTLGAKPAPEARAEGAPPVASSTPPLTVRRMKITGGRLTLERQGSGAKPLVLDAVELEVRDFAPASAFPLTLQAALNGGGALKLAGTLGPVATNAAETPLDVTVDLSKLDLAASGWIQSSPGLAGIIALQGRAVTDGKVARVTGKLKGEHMRFTTKGKPADRLLEADLAVEHHLKTHQGRLTKGDLHVGGAVARLTGNYAIQTAATIVHMKLKGDKMAIPELAAMLPPAGVTLPNGASLEEGVASLDLSLDGPTTRLVTSGPLSFDATKLANFDMGKKMNMIQSLAGMQTGKDTVIETLRADVRVDPEGIHTDNLVVKVPAIGEMTGAGAISATDELSYRMVARVKTSGLASVISGEPITFTVTGQATDPVFRADVKAIVKDQIRSRAADAAQGLLKGLFGPKKPQQ